MKKSLPRITEPSYSPDMVHYRAYWGADAVTLCGKTDFLGEIEGEETERPVTCRSCQQVVAYVHGHTKPKT